MLPAKLTDSHGPPVKGNPVAAPGGPHPAVRRLIFADGTRVIAKRYIFYDQTAGHPHDLLETETAVTRCLANAGCPVATVLATDPESGTVYLEDVAHLTLDDVVQSAHPTARARLGDRVIEDFHCLQLAFSQSDDELRARVAPGTDQEAIRESFLEVFSKLDVDAPLGDGLLELAHTLSKRPLHLGPTDYNARNILITETGEPTFIDLAKVGYDWPERRLVQYATSLGAGRPGSTVTSLLDPISLRYYTPARSAKVRQSLDAHHLLFHTLAMLRGMRVTQRALTLSLSKSRIVADVRRKMGRIWEQTRAET